MNNFLKLLFCSLAICFITGNSAYSYEVSAVKAYNQGMDLNYQGKYEEAITCFKHALELDPTFLEVYSVLGATYEQTGDNAKAIESYKSLLAKNPKDYETAYKIALKYSEDDLNKDKTAYYLKKIPSESSRYKDAKVLAESLGIKLDLIPVQHAVNKTPVQPKKEVKTVIAGFIGPAGVAKDSKGNLYVANYGDNSIVQISRLGAKRVLFKGAPLKGPLGLAIDLFDNIYVANYAADEILKISLKTNSVNVLYKNVSRPYYIILDSSGYLYVTEQGSNSLAKFKVF